MLSRTHCEVCGSSRSRTLLVRDFEHPSVRGFLVEYYQGRVDFELLRGGAYELLRCASCTFVWQRWVLDTAGMQRLYGEWIEPAASLSKHRAKASRVVLSSVRQVLAAAELAGRPVHELRVLDHAMGWGTWCRAAKGLGAEVWGTELEPSRLRLALERGVRIVDGAQLPNDFFDFVNSEQALEHLVAPGAELARLVRALRPGGVIHIGVPSSEADVRRVEGGAWTRAAKDSLQPLEHVNTFNERSLAVLVRSAGLRPVPAPLFPLVAANPRDFVLALAAGLRRRFRPARYFRRD
jgi:SAM-dependent methyltransferase